jgi:hypothetical protein
MALVCGNGLLVLKALILGMNKAIAMAGWIMGQGRDAPREMLGGCFVVANSYLRLPRGYPLSIGWRGIVLYSFLVLVRGALKPRG